MAYLRWDLRVLCAVLHRQRLCGALPGDGLGVRAGDRSVLQQTIRVILAYTLAGPMGLAGVALAIGTGWSAIVLYQTFCSGPKSAFVKMSNRFEKQGTFFDESVL